MAKLLEALLRVAGAIDNAPHLHPSRSAGTHRAGLDGDIQRAVGQILAAQRVGGGGEGYHLRVGRHVLQPLGVVVRPSHNLAVADYHRPYRHLVLVARLAGFAQRLLHIELVLVVEYTHSQFFLKIFISFGIYLPVEKWNTKSPFI